MQEFEYRCVAGPVAISVKNEKQRMEAVKSYEHIINREAQKGWEYVGIDRFETVEPQGCFGMGGMKTTVMKMLVFKRQVKMDSSVDGEA